MRVLKIALFVSLAINLLVLGFFAAAAAKHWRGGETGLRAIAAGPNKLEHRGPYNKDGQRRGPAARQAPPMLLWPLMSQLTKEERRAFAKSVRRAHAEAGFTREEVAVLTGQIADALETDPLDIAALKMAVLNLRTVMQSRSVLVEDNLLRLVADMPVEKRKALAAELRKPRKGGKKR